MLQGVFSMEITAGILFYLLGKDKDMQHICHGADHMELKSAELCRDSAETEEGVLYVYKDQRGVLLFAGKRKYNTSFILSNAFRDKGESFSTCLIPCDTGSNKAGEEMKAADPADEIMDDIRRIRYSFARIQNAILEDILEQEDIVTVMEKVRELLRESFTVVDRDMLLLYQCPDVPVILTGKLGESYAQELEEELLVAKEFHSVAKRTEPFYYRLNVLDLESYCINILVDGYYLARLVVMPKEGAVRLESGAEQLSGYLAEVLVKMIRRGGLKIQRSQGDLLHRICFQAAGGVRPEPDEIKKAVSAYGWSQGDVYQVFCLEPYNTEGWEMQVENTIPLITRKIEQTWTQSCAAYVGKQIFWIVNQTQQEKRTGKYELTQQWVVFLRENVLRAGGSSRFRNAALLAAAFKQAGAALEIGTAKNPSSWFHRFDDCRLEYMISAIREKDTGTELLINPAIPLLTEYDAKHESQLSETLKMLVEKRGNVTQAAGALFIHRTTLFRRLNQVKEITGLDLEDPDVMLELQLSYRIM